MTQEIFPVVALKALAERHRSAFLNLGAIEKALMKRFFGLEDAIRALSLAAACREPLLLIGPPGTAKSQLIRAFCNYLGITVPERRGGNGHFADDRYFEYLLTPFTEPGELFGYYDILKLQKLGEYERSDAGMIQKAIVVYLDEVFNASSAILNSLLALLNEGRFHDRNNIVQANWQLLLGATNHLPDSDALLAVYDRFLLRCQVDNVAAGPEGDDLQTLLQVGWRETYRGAGNADAVGSFPTLLNDLAAFRGEASQLIQAGNMAVQANSDFYRSLVTVVHLARSRYQLSELSNRRLIKFLFVMMTHAIYHYISTGKEEALRLGEKELRLLIKYGMDRRDDQATGALMAFINSPERGR